MKGCLRKQKFEYFRCSSPKSTLLSPQQLGKFNSFKKLVESKIISKSDRSLCHASPDQSDKVNRGTNQRTLYYNFYNSGSLCRQCQSSSIRTHLKHKQWYKSWKCSSTFGKGQINAKLEVINCTCIYFYFQVNFLINL